MKEVRCTSISSIIPKTHQQKPFQTTGVSLWHNFLETHHFSKMTNRENDPRNITKPKVAYSRLPNCTNLFSMEILGRGRAVSEYRSSSASSCRPNPSLMFHSTFKKHFFFIGPSFCASARFLVIFWLHGCILTLHVIHRGNCSNGLDTLSPVLIFNLSGYM